MTAQAHTRPGDPWTSHEAAKGVHTANQRARVWDILTTWGPLTDEELVAEYESHRAVFGWPPASASGLRSRRAELVADGYVVATKDTGRTALGGVTIRWAPAPIQGELW